MPPDFFDQGARNKERMLSLVLSTVHVPPNAMLYPLHS